MAQPEHEAGGQQAALGPSAAHGKRAWLYRAGTHLPSPCPLPQQLSSRSWAPRLLPPVQGSLQRSQHQALCTGATEQTPGSTPSLGSNAPSALWSCHCFSGVQGRGEPAATGLSQGAWRVPSSLGLGSAQSPKMNFPARFHPKWSFLRARLAAPFQPLQPVHPRGLLAGGGVRRGARAGGFPGCAGAGQVPRAASFRVGGPGPG